jgi:hypothetical protein
MHRTLAQVVALVLAIAGVLNAQCFAACAMLSLSTPDHACCPHHKNAPARHQGSEAPCSHTKAEIGGISTAAVSPVAVIVTSAPELLPPQFFVSAGVLPVAVITAPHLRPSIAVLRI